ncbi:sugar phosphate isomerase/epimerase family protein [Thermoactinospora rubra]|uniref:sugar phosphate isomerase/epimerase family protein n=1 Tax=Thermoactinospora rubra TaxID=1088767 RepID=UPI00117F726D|nr:sugar phosphate isomerase/epimerase family protein [Thermoactinospora rubra]
MTTDTQPNPIGVHALVWAGDTGPSSIAFAVGKTKATGFDLLEISLHDSANLDVAATRDALKAAGLGVACSRGLAFDADVSSEDPAVVERGEKLLHDSLAATRALGGTHFTGEAQPYGMTLGLEICNRYETNVVNTARDALVLADDIGEDNVLIHLDTYHMNIEEDDFVRPVHEVGDRLGYVHVGENHRGYLGSGHLDFASFFHALADVDYRGPVTFESFSSAVVMRGLSNDLAIWRNLWSDGEDLARHARAFIADHLHTSRTR